MHPHRSMKFPALLTLLAALWLSLPAVAADKGWFGFGVSIEASGSSENPIVQSVTVQDVAPGSPAAQAGLASGDVILEADGMPLSGVKTDAMKAAMSRQVGETLRLRIRRGDAVRVVTLTAAARPAAG